ncbi:hypothetical protein D3C75_844790 [compost metagenome]
MNRLVDEQAAAFGGETPAPRALRIVILRSIPCQHRFDTQHFSVGVRLQQRFDLLAARVQSVLVTDTKLACCVLQRGFNVFYFAWIQRYRLFREDVFSGGKGGKNHFFVRDMRRADVYHVNFGITQHFAVIGVITASVTLGQ